MEQHRSEIKLSSKSWHARLINWTFGFKTKDFKNLCPYFWLMIASIFLFIPITPFKLIYLGFSKLVRMFCNYIYRQTEKSFENLPQELSDGELFLLYSYFETDEKYRSKVRTGIGFKLIESLAKKVRRISRSSKSLEDLFKLLPKTTQWKKKESDYNWMVKQREILERKMARQEEERYKKEANKKKTIAKIAEVTKFIIVLINCFAISCAGYLLTYLFTELVCWFCFRGIDGLLIILKIVGGLIFVVALLIACIYGTIQVKEWWEYREKKTVIEWILLSPIFVIYAILRGIYYLVWELLIKSVLLGILVGIKTGFEEYGGIFSKYLNASYSDYCPGIKWEEEK